MTLVDCQQCGRKRQKCTETAENICRICWHTNQLKKIHPKIVKFTTLFILSVEVSDYNEPIEDENYLIVRIDNSMQNELGELIKFWGIQEKHRPEFPNMCKYLVAGNFVETMRERIDDHIFNRANPTIFNYRPSYITSINITDARCNRYMKPNKSELKTIDSDVIRDIIEIASIRKSGTNPQIEDKDVQFILQQINIGEDSEEYLFRGVNKFRGEDDGISSSIYRKNSNIALENILQEHEEFIANKLLDKQYYKSKNIINALTDLRHSGMETCLLDFSHNFKIALFFSCFGNENWSESGEIIMMKKSKMETLEEISYPHVNDFVLVPKSKDTGIKSRINAQDSVFIYCHEGYLSRSKYSKIMNCYKINSSIKQILLEYSGYSEESIYPDFRGFIDNIENLNSPAALFIQAKELITNAAKEGVDISEKIKHYKNALSKLRTCLINSKIGWKKYDDIIQTTINCKKYLEKSLIEQEKEIEKNTPSPFSFTRRLGKPKIGLSRVKKPSTVSSKLSRVKKPSTVSSKLSRVKKPSTVSSKLSHRKKLLTVSKTPLKRTSK